MLKTDLIKSEFCRENGIPLIRIPFWEKDNLKLILKKELKKMKIL